MARVGMVLAGLCASLPSRLLQVRAEVVLKLDPVCFLQEFVHVDDGRLRGDMPLRGSFPGSLLQADLAIKQGVSDVHGLPSLASLIIPVTLVGVALCAASTLCGCRNEKGPCCYVTGCCGSTLIFLAVALIVAKVVLASMAGPAPAGPAPLEPLATRMEVETSVPFTVAQINTPGPIHDVYKRGMQRAIDIMPGATPGDQVVTNVQARKAGEELRAPVMTSLPNQNSTGNRVQFSQNLSAEQGTPDMRDGPACKDDPDTWLSDTGYSCQDYLEHKWCTSDGGYGAGWGASWGTFQNYTTNGQSSPIAACCACGGGYRGTTSTSVILTYKLAAVKGAVVDQASSPQVTTDMVNNGIKQAAQNATGKAGAAEGLEFAPQGLKELAVGATSALSSSTIQISTEARIRCRAHHSFPSDLREAARIILKKKMPEIANGIEKATAEHGSLPLMLGSRCNDPAQAEEMRVCIGDSTAWVDLVSVGAASLPSSEHSVEGYLCRVSCDIQKVLVEHKDEAIQEVNEKVSGISLDEDTIWGLTCSPSLSDEQQCPPCS